MVLPLSHLNSVEYYNKPDNAWEDYYYAQAFPEESSLQRGGNVPIYHGPVLQRGYGLESIFKSVARSVMPSLKEIVKSALTTGLEVLQDVAKGENIRTVAKKRLKENSLAFLDDTGCRMSHRKSIKGKSQSVHQNLRNVIIVLESLTTLYFQSQKKKETEKWPNLFIKILMIGVLRVSIFSYFLPPSRVFKKASLSIIIQSHHSQMVDQ